MNDQSLSKMQILWNILLQVGAGASASQMQASPQMDGAGRVVWLDEGMEWCQLCRHL